MRTMIKVRSFPDILGRHFAFPGKVVVDVGCGTGDLARLVEEESEVWAQAYRSICRLNILERPV